MHVIATAGHVDHGKSTLIERLTGIDPDRLAEEKARGLTIDLGFAWLTLPSGREIGIVDVPGHERFIHTMLAGACNVDAVLFIVAANEGWKPQSEEHLQILDLLGARRAVIVITKCDLVTETGSVRRQIAARVAGTALAGAPILPVSAVTGQGLDDLVQALDAMLVDEPEDRGRARLYVDRSFSAKGAGTIVTGTLTGGRMRVGDDVQILPIGHSARIRGIQSHKSSREEGEPVARVALNLAGIERSEVTRGDAVVHPGAWEATTQIDVEVRAVRSLDHAIGARGAYKCYVGTAEVDARLTTLGPPALEAGQRTYARLRLSAPVVVSPFDRFVMRDASRQQTVAGGVILDASPVALRPDARIPQLRARAEAHPDDIPSLLVAERGSVARSDLARLSGSTAEPRDAVALRTFFVSNSRFDELAGEIERTLAEHHAREPLAAGMPRDEARREARIDDRTLFDEIVEALRERITAEGTRIRLRTHVVHLSEGDTRALIQRLRTAGMQPPPQNELEETYGAALVRAAIDQGLLRKVADGMVFGALQIEEAKQAIADAMSREGSLTAARIKDVLGTSRKYAIPLLEHLDATGFTRRRGDLRELAP